MAPRNEVTSPFEQTFYSDKTTTEAPAVPAEASDKEVSFWENPIQFFQAIEDEMNAMANGKSVNFVGSDEKDGKLEVHFQLVNMKPEEILRIGVTPSHFLEIEAAINIPDEDKKDGEGNFLWALPIGPEYKTDQPEFVFNQDKLTVSLLKDPDYKQETEDAFGETEAEGEAAPEVDSIIPFHPFFVSPEEVCQEAEIIQPISANIEESDEQVKITFNLEGFQVNEIELKACQGKVLKVEGQKKESGVIEDNKLKRKSFGRLFWFPQGYNSQHVKATAHLDGEKVEITILVPKGIEISNSQDEEIIIIQEV